MINTPFKVICINDSHKPAEIPTSMWVKKDETYTVTSVMRMGPQNGIPGFKLAEVELKGCAPYEFYSSDRFGPLIPESFLKEIEQLLQPVTA